MTKISSAVLPVTARTFVDRFYRIEPDFLGCFNLSVIDPRQQLVLEEINFSPLTAAWNLTQTRQRIDRVTRFAQNPACFVNEDGPAFRSRRLELG